MDKSIEDLGNEIVLASAGSGKTYRLSQRVVGLILRGVEPRKIAALTFTKKAAGEFADAILEKLATAALSEAEAAQLASEIGLKGASQQDFVEALQEVVDQLPELFLGTLDSFFARVVRCFQYELGVGGGSFELVEGEAAKILSDDLIADILRGQSLSEEQRLDFLQAFKMATLGAEENRISRELSNFVREWHRRFLSDPDAVVWGDSAVALPEMESREVELQKRRDELLGKFELVAPDHPKVPEMIEYLARYSIGSGKFADKGLIAKVIEGWSEFQSGSAGVVFNRKEIEFSEVATTLLREIVETIAAQEALIKLTRTAAMWQVMSAYESRYDRVVRQSGRMTFDDLKLKMTEWSKSEMARVRREWIDFRLDSRYDQWLLDEFQDTSPDQWLGVQTLIDEAVQSGDPERGLFVVGDKKQAIFAWRGGDHTLFNAVKERYGEAIEEFPLSDSFRSQPPLLDLVNEVFGRPELMRSFFPERAVKQWHWDPHAMSAKKESESAYAVVKEVAKGESLEAMQAIIDEVDPVTRGISCGVLLRGNDKVAEVAERLRQAGYPVAEEGMCQPGQDSPVGRAAVDLLRWLQNPADNFAERHLRMAGLLEGEADEAWSVWHREANEKGWAVLISEVLPEGLSDFGVQRLEQILQAIESAVAGGITTAGELARMLHESEAPTDEMEGAIQVMTIHKSKGLGFDMVVLPEISDQKIVQSQHFTLCRTEDDRGRTELLTQVPPKWARQVLPVYREAEEEWEIGQIYEAFCLLYVAMTRAKRGLYCLLPEAGKEERASYADWIRAAVGGDYESGDARWFAEIAKEEDISVEEEFSLPPLALRPQRRQASHVLSGELTPERVAALEFGAAVHAVFEKMTWLDELPAYSDESTEKTVMESLEVPEIFAIFQRPQGDVQLYREQGIELILDGHWVTGVIDRMHVHRVAGEVTAVDIYDFKTDEIDEAGLVERHSSQMRTYRRAVAHILAVEEEKVSVHLVSTHLKRVI